MNPYDYLEASKAGEDYRYVRDTELVMGAVSAAVALKKAKPIEELLSPAYKNPRYEAMRTMPRDTRHAQIRAELEKRYRGFTSYADLRAELVSFLSGSDKECYAVPTSFAPPNAETNLIASQLQGIVGRGFLTWDSEPGLLVFEDDSPSYLQNPYLYISGPEDAIVGLLTTLSKVQYELQRPVRLVDPRVYKMLMQTYDSNDTLGPMIYLDNYITWGDLRKELSRHVLVVLVAEDWRLPFFTIVYNAAFGEAIGHSTIDINLHLF